jgi:glycosyltransferase involved in cell wall biosynthesis
VTTRPESSPVDFVWIVTSALTARVLLADQLRHFLDRGYAVGLIAAPGDHLEPLKQIPGLRIATVSMKRQASPSADLAALVAIWRVLRAWRPRIVNASTPKAGLLGMLAAVLARVPIRIYFVRGLRLETLKGIRRVLLQGCEAIAASCATQVACVSPSLRERFVALVPASRHKICVVGSGGSRGIDVDRYAAAAAACTVPESEDSDNHDFVVGFVGRLAGDKGVTDLITAFRIVRASCPEARLRVIGWIDEDDAAAKAALAAVSGDPQVHVTGFVADPADYLHAVHVLAFPSYREGLPNAPLEAAAAGTPTVGYRVTGTVDAVVDGVTGTLVEKGDVDAFARALVRYRTDPELRRRHGEAARERVGRLFRTTDVCSAWERAYVALSAQPALREAVR